MKVSLLQAKLWPLHANNTISFLRSGLLHKIQWGDHGQEYTRGRGTGQWTINQAVGKVFCCPSLS